MTRSETDHRVVLIGQAPSQTSDPDHPLSGRSGERLTHLLGVPVGEAFDLRNVLPAFPGRRGDKGDRFPLWRARLGAWRLARQLKGRSAVFLGLGVARAFSRGEMPVLTWLPGPHPLAWSAILPHPSGVNLWWNSLANTVAAQLFLIGAAAGKAKWPA